MNNVKATTVGTAERAAAVAEDTDEKAKGFFEQGFNAVQVGPYRRESNLWWKEAEDWILEYL